VTPAAIKPTHGKPDANGIKSEPLTGDSARSSENTPPEGHRLAEADLDLDWLDEPSLDPCPVTLETRGITSQVPKTRKKNAPKLSVEELWEVACVHKNSIAAKLRHAGLADRAAKLEECHTRRTFAQCDGCHTVKVFLNRCDLNYCPQCQPRLAHRRSESLRWWIREAAQAKHVVLTVRNSAAITKNYLRWIKKCFSRLRRRKFADNWEGGFYSLEITNEGKGWHVHLHALVNARWIDAPTLAREWADIVGQDFAIVHVEDAREETYLKEVAKYCVKGSQLAGWSHVEVADFVMSLEGVRTFGVFGSLYKKRTTFADWIASIKGMPKACACGSWDCHFYSEMEWAIRDLVPLGELNRPPPGEFQATLDMECPTPRGNHYALE
jgi:hypothetical protein